MSGTLYMIPCPISEEGLNTIPKDTIELLHRLDHFVVERARTTRRYIKSTGHPKTIDSLNIFELDKEQPESQELFSFLKQLKTGQSIGVISEAGCPGIADPGAIIVHWAHQNNIKVVPLVGPSSIFLALMGSGMNGQGFCFHGYLPAKTNEMSKALKRVESLSISTRQTQIFMEAPYRNKNIFEQALKALSTQTKLCIACDINTSQEYIKTMTIDQWKKQNAPDLHKRPCIFLLGK